MSMSPEPSTDPTPLETGQSSAMDHEVNVEDNIMTQSSTSHPAQKPRTGNALSKLAESSSDSEDEAPIPKQRGKLLAHLQSKAVSDSSGSDEEEDDDGEGAYERMKKKLMSGKGQQESPKQQEPLAKLIESDEDEMPVLANRTRRPITPKKSASLTASSASVRSRRSSPGLFVTPDPSPAKKKPSRSPFSGSDTEASAKRPSNADLQERVKRIRAERLAKQREQEEREKLLRRVGAESESNSDGESGRRLTQQTRPTRRAGKKALEEMARDQQRIQRNMQLTHKAKTKKKYSTKDLCAKFGYNPNGENKALPTPDASSAPVSSDMEAAQAHDTPPMSPPSQEENFNKDGANILAGQTAASPSSNKGKGRAPEYQHVPLNQWVERSHPVTVQNFPTENQKPSADSMVELSDSDDDLEVVQPKSRFPVFDRVPQKKQQENPALLHLRHLAHLTSPSKKARKGFKTMTSMELQTSLFRRMQEQSHQARQEKIEELKRRGIHVETEEEREKHQEEIEDLAAQFEKARQEDLKLAKLEREEAKKNGEIGGGILSSDESDDDYVASDKEDVGDVEDESADEAEIELSGSEDEEIQEADDEDSEAEQPNGMFDDMADEDADDASQQSHHGEDDAEERFPVAPSRKSMNKRARHVVVDDEDESADEVLQGSATQKATQEDDAMAAFGFDNANAGNGPGLTQMFAGTMAEIEGDSQSALAIGQEEQNSLDFLRCLPDTQPSASFNQDYESLWPESQPGQSQHPQAQHNSPFSMGVSQVVPASPAFSRTQYSEAPEPTQDAGFELSRSPAGFYPPQSTIDTVVMSPAESPIVTRKGKLHRGRREGPLELSDLDEAVSGSDAEVEARRAKTKDAFSALQKGAKREKKVSDFNKKTSWAKDAIEEQAEESEDEYAGIGGASDDDSDEEADEELAKMIDTDDVKVNKSELDAYYQDQIKKADEKRINQLFKDVNGGFRRRAGNGAFDVSDSEDEAVMRRRRKQREFQKMTKALVSDERIGKIADNPKQAAFFQTLADHMDDPDYDFLAAPPEADNDADMESSQSQPHNQEAENMEADGNITIPDSQTETTMKAPPNPLKRKSPSSQKENRPPPNLRRTAAAETMTRKPLTHADVQHSVSELLDEPQVMVPNSQLSDAESDNENSAATSNTLFANQNSRAQARKPIIDRLSLSRSSTNFSTNSTSTAGNGTMAFHSGSVSAQPGFRIPSLVRRATSNFSVESTTSGRGSSGANTPVEGTGVRKGGTGRSNIHAQAREAERMAMLKKGDAKRNEVLKKKVGRARGKRSVLRDLGGGFE